MKIGMLLRLLSLPTAVLVALASCGNTGRSKSDAGTGADGRADGSSNEANQDADGDDSARGKEAGWSVSREITDSEFAGVNPRAAVDAQGNVFVVWKRQEGSTSPRYSLFAKRYSVATDSWAPPRGLEPLPSDGIGTGQVAVDEAGNAIVVWARVDHMISNIWATRYSAASDSWGDPTLIELNDGGDAVEPRIGVNSRGDAIVAWGHGAGEKAAIWVNAYSAASGTWGTSQELSRDLVGAAGIPSIGIDDSGNALVLWEQKDAVRTNIVARRYEKAVGTWTSPAILDVLDSNASSPAIAVSHGGDAAAVWVQDDPLSTNIDLWAARWSAAGNAWSVAARVETSAGEVKLLPRVAIDDAGNAVAAWPFVAPGVSSIAQVMVARAIDPTGAWGQTEVIGAAGLEPDLAVDGTGNAILTWLEVDSPLAAVFGAHYDAAAKQWAVTQIEEKGWYRGDAHVAIGRTGHGVVVWDRADAPLASVWAQRFW